MRRLRRAKYAMLKKELKDEGLIKQVGSGRATKYIKSQDH